jgi:hypothetical protein
MPVMVQTRTNICYFMIISKTFNKKAPRTPKLSEYQKKGGQLIVDIFDCHFV